ncbi:MAG: PEP-CTERM sorting domain-containing protein [Planctomycetota bacterium]|nr:PEP-CTERM sorting domain-containing protein [Planctomycetota bacterium]
MIFDRKKVCSRWILVAALVIIKSVRIRFVDTPNQRKLMKHTLSICVALFGFFSAFGIAAEAGEQPAQNSTSATAKSIADQPFKAVSPEYIVTKVALKVAQAANRAMGNETPIQFIPEPSTYALAAVATGVLAAIARRRRKAAQA